MKKNLHGFARDLAIGEMLNKEALLERAGAEWGLEDDHTIKLYAMKNTSTYADMLNAYKAYTIEMEEEMGSED